MDPAFCVTTMEVLPDNHLLVRKEVEPKKILELIADNPAQLIVEALESYPNRATTAIDLEITLAQVIGEESSRSGGPTPGRPSPRTPASRCPRRRPSATSCARRRLRRGRDLRPVQFHALRPPQDLARRGLCRRIGPQGAQRASPMSSRASPTPSRTATSLRRRALYGAAVRDPIAKVAGSTHRPSSPRRPRLSPTCATCRRSPRRSRSSSRATSWS